MRTPPPRPTGATASRFAARGVALVGLGEDPRRWPSRRWRVAAGTALVTIVFIAVPTDLIDTAWFSREVPPEVWSWPVLVVGAVLAGMVTASYVARADAVPERVH